MFSNQWQVQCCRRGDTNPNCKEGGNVKCSPQFYKNRLEYFSTCPQMTKKNCGYEHNYMDLDLYASNDNTNFRVDGLRWKTNKYKVPTYQACTYKVMNPPGGYKGGKVYLTVEKKEAGMRLYFRKNGKDVTLRLNSEYNVQNGEEFMITAVPTKNSFNTTFSLKYRTDGTKDPNAEIW